MNLLRKLPLMAILAIVFISITAGAQKVVTDYDHAANFTQYHTYSWGHVLSSDPLFEQRIRDAVDHDLQAKGWQQVPEGGEVTLTAVLVNEKSGRVQHVLHRTGGRLEVAWLGQRHGNHNDRPRPGRNPDRRYV